MSDFADLQQAKIDKIINTTKKYGVIQLHERIPSTSPKLIPGFRGVKGGKIKLPVGLSSNHEF